jgi:hypothetical protein
VGQNKIRETLHCELEKLSKASIIYAVHALQSGYSQALIPIGLQMDKLPAAPPNATNAYLDQAINVEQSYILQNL